MSLINKNKSLTPAQVVIQDVLAVRLMDTYALLAGNKSDNVVSIYRVAASRDVCGDSLDPVNDDLVINVRTLHGTYT